jgi:hypothetical protein
MNLQNIVIAKRTARGHSLAEQLLMTKIAGDKIWNELFLPRCEMHSGSRTSQLCTNTEDMYTRNIFLSQASSLRPLEGIT